jgi:hypothetical protein
MSVCVIISTSVCACVGAVASHQASVTDSDIIARQREEQGRDGEARGRPQGQREESARSAGAAAGANKPPILSYPILTYLIYLTALHPLACMAVQHDLPQCRAVNCVSVRNLTVLSAS